jgi:hypothetical protein
LFVAMGAEAQAQPPAGAPAAANEKQKSPPDREADTSNPYAPSEKLSRDQLGQFLDKMQSKPETIRKRPGFAEALILAADRILAGGADDDLATAALLAKFRALHFLSLADNAEASEQLLKLGQAMRGDKREKIAQEADFCLLERRVLDADELVPEDLPPLLAELKPFFARETLENRHVRMASATVLVINRLKDDKAATAAYREFGSLFAKSKDPELARYGRKIEKGPQQPPAADPKPEEAGGRDSPSPSP